MPKKCHVAGYTSGGNPGMHGHRTGQPGGLHHHPGRGAGSIFSAFTREAARSSGVATALLEQALTWARERDSPRCTVDFEAMNYLARRFWLKWFRPVCYSLVHGINEQTLKTNR